MADKFPPTQNLADESLPAGQRDFHPFHLRQDVRGNEAMDVEQSGEPGVEKTPGPGGHGVLVRAEKGQAIPFRPIPEFLSIGSGPWQMIYVESSRMVGEALLDQPPDFFFDWIPGKRRRGRSRGAPFQDSRFS